jgi:hypothetical protein
MRSVNRSEHRQDVENLIDVVRRHARCSYVNIDGRLWTGLPRHRWSLRDWSCDSAANHALRANSTICIDLSGAYVGSAAEKKTLIGGQSTRWRKGRDGIRHVLGPHAASELISQTVRGGTGPHHDARVVTTLRGSSLAGLAPYGRVLLTGRCS